MSSKPHRHNRKARERLRRRMFICQSGLCHLCGELLTLKRGGGSNVGNRFATFDHVIPHAFGGTAHVKNLKLAHRACNSARNARFPESYPSVDIGWRRSLTSSLRTRE